MEKSQNHWLHGTTSERVLDIQRLSLIRIDDGAYSRHGVDPDLVTPKAMGESKGHLVALYSSEQYLIKQFSL